ncbi:MAG TPA: hypothetical protein VIY49_31370 [Bryobacteraceae bacterium]
MVIAITSVADGSGALQTCFTPNPAQVLVTDELAWSNEDSRQGPEGVHWIESADGSFTYFDPQLLPVPPPSNPYFFSGTDAGHTFQYRCKLHPNETGQFTVVTSLATTRPTT